MDTIVNRLVLTVAGLMSMVSADYYKLDEE